MAKKKELFGIMNDTVKVKFAIVRILKGNKLLYLTDVAATGIDKGTVGWDSKKTAHFFDDRFEAEKLVCLMIPHGVADAFVLEVPDYFPLENFRNK